MIYPSILTIRTDSLVGRRVLAKPHCSCIKGIIELIKVALLFKDFKTGFSLRNLSVYEKKCC
jgi:hypothetical protein